MKTQIRFLMTLLCAAGASLLIIAPPAQAGYLVTLEQVGPDVVATGTGEISLTGLTCFLCSGAANQNSGITPSLGIILVQSGSVDVYTGFSGPSSFGSGNATFPNNSIGSTVGIQGRVGFVTVPHGYASGTVLSDSSTYNNATLSSLGVTPGTYEWTWGTGLDQSFTLQIGAVPDSGATFDLLLLASSGLFGLSRFRSFRSA